MIRKTAAVEAFLAGGGTLQTRLRARSEEDVHDLSASSRTFSAVLLRAAAAALEELETQGVVRRSLVVHPFDSSEYQVSWHIPGTRRAVRRNPYYFPRR